MSRAASLMALLAFSGCNWLYAVDAQDQYCAQFSKGPPTDEKRALLEPCSSASDCLCPKSLCLHMVMLDGGVEKRCNPPDDAARTCPLFFDSNVVKWQSGDGCLTTCPVLDQKQCVGAATPGLRCVGPGLCQ